MLNLIYDWIKNILVYLILITLIINLLPEGNYKKYIKVFTGLILILIVISPLANIIGMENHFNMNITDISLQLNKAELLKQQNLIKEEQQGHIFESYKDELAKQIKLKLEQESLYVSDIHIEMNQDIYDEEFGNITYIDIIGTTHKVNDSKTIKIDKVIISNNNQVNVKSAQEIVYEKKIKSLLSNFYNLSVDNIHISIQ